MLFWLLIVAGLARVEPDTPVADSERYGAELEALYLGDGWYRDGPGQRVDHYNGFAFHIYALLLTCLAPQKPSIDYLDRARLFAPNFAGWFDPDGRGLAYGRSMTFRFAMTAFFGALCARRGRRSCPGLGLSQGDSPAQHQMVVAPTHC